jgi:hypothetical protein
MGASGKSGSGRMGSGGSGGPGGSASHKLPSTEVPARSEIPAPNSRRDEIPPKCVLEKSEDGSKDRGRSAPLSQFVPQF